MKFIWYRSGLSKHLVCAKIDDIGFDFSLKGALQQVTLTNEEASLSIDKLASKYPFVVNESVSHTPVASKVPATPPLDLPTGPNPRKGTSSQP